MFDWIVFVVQIPKNLGLRFLSELDCFHPNAVANGGFAIGLWNKYVINGFWICFSKYSQLTVRSSVCSNLQARNKRHWTSSIWPLCVLMPIVFFNKTKFLSCLCVICELLIVCCCCCCYCGCCCCWYSCDGKNEDKIQSFERWIVSFFLNSSSLLKTLTTTTISSIMSSFTLETPSLSNLPSELLFQVLMNLDAQSLCRLRTTCKDFYKCPDEMGFWKHFVLKEWCLEASGSFL